MLLPLFFFSIQNKLFVFLPTTKYAKITKPKKSSPKTKCHWIEISRYKKTVVFDPAKSETYRALQDEQQYGGARVHEIPITVQHQTYNPHAGGKVSTNSILRWKISNKCTHTHIPITYHCKY